MFDTSVILKQLLQKHEKTHSRKCANVLLGLKEKYECLGQQPEISQVGLIFLNLLSDIIFYKVIL
jgi:hypothetical protein